MNKFEINLRAFWGKVREKLPKLFKEEFLEDANVSALLFISGVVLAACWIFSVIRFRPSEFLVPVRYNSFLGVTQLGKWYELYYLPAVLTLCFTLNVLLANFIYKKDKMVSYILVSSNIFLTMAGLAVIVNLGLLAGI